MVGWRQYGTGVGCVCVGLPSGGRSVVQLGFGTEAPAGAAEAPSPAASAPSAQATPILSLLATR